MCPPLAQRKKTKQNENSSDQCRLACATHKEGREKNPLQFQSDIKSSIQ